MLFYLIYISKAVKLLSDDELDFLLVQSREKNLAYGITGMLLYVKGEFTEKGEEGRFIQVLEGTEADVRFIYSKIEVDTRHHNLIILEEKLIEERNFDKWSMGFHPCELENFRNNKAFFDLEYSFLNYKKEEELNKPLEMLKGFYSIHLNDTTQ